MEVACAAMVDVVPEVGLLRGPMGPWPPWGGIPEPVPLSKACIPFGGDGFL